MTKANEHVLVNPVTQPVVAPFDGAPRLASLAGTRLGIIDDSKRNADVLLEELSETIKPHLPENCMFIRYDLIWENQWANHFVGV